MTNKNGIEVVIPHWDVDQFARAIANAAYDGDDIETRLTRKFETLLSEKIEEAINALIDTRLEAIVDDVFDKGIIVSEDWEDKVQRKPISEIVAQAASEWATKKQNDGYGSKGKTHIELIAEKHISAGLSTEAEKIMKEVRNDAIATARKRISDTVAQRLFPGKDSKLPF